MARLQRRRRRALRRGRAHVARHVPAPAARPVLGLSGAHGGVALHPVLFTFPLGRREIALHSYGLLIAAGLARRHLGRPPRGGAPRVRPGAGARPRVLAGRLGPDRLAPHLRPGERAQLLPRLRRRHRPLVARLHEPARGLGGGPGLLRRRRRRRRWWRWSSRGARGGRSATSAICSRRRWRSGTPSAGSAASPPAAASARRPPRASASPSRAAASPSRSCGARARCRSAPARRRRCTRPSSTRRPASWRCSPCCARSPAPPAAARRAAALLPRPLRAAAVRGRDFRGDVLRGIPVELETPRLAGWLGLPPAEPIFLSAGQLGSLLTAAAVAAALVWRHRAPRTPAP